MIAAQPPRANNKPGQQTQAAGSMQKSQKARQAAAAASAVRAGQAASARSAFEHAPPRRASCDHAKVVDLLASAIEELNAEVPAEQGRINGNANAALHRGLNTVIKSDPGAAANVA